MLLFIVVDLLLPRNKYDFVTMVRKICRYSALRFAGYLISTVSGAFLVQSNIFFSYSANPIVLHYSQSIHALVVTTLFFFLVTKNSGGREWQG